MVHHEDLIISWEGVWLNLDWDPVQLTMWCERGKKIKYKSKMLKNWKFKKKLFKDWE